MKQVQNLHSDITVWKPIAKKHLYKSTHERSDQGDMYAHIAVATNSRYAHIEIVVTFLVVNFFGFLVITRHHTMRF